MKKVFNITLTILLIYFSFYYTNKVSNYIKSKDPIMIKINNVKNKYYKKPIDAVISNNTIIPGLSGLEININESYSNMKKVNTFIPDMLVFDSIKPSISLKDNLDKLVISGNKETNNVSILLKVNNLDMLKSIVSINNNYNLILSNSFINNNLDYLNTISNNILTEDIKEVTSYCYTENIKKTNLCNTIPTIYLKPITYNYYYNTLNDLDNGSILTYNIQNNSNLQELNKVTSSIKNMGYKIVNLDTLLKE